MYEVCPEMCVNDSSTETDALSTNQNHRQVYIYIERERHLLIYCGNSCSVLLTANCFYAHHKHEVQLTM